MSEASKSPPEDSAEKDAVHNGNIAEALRSQTGKVFKAVVDIEEKSHELAEEFSVKLAEVTQEDIECSFLELSIYSGSPLPGHEPDSHHAYVVAGDDDQPISCFRVNRNTARSLLALTFGGPSAKLSDLGEGKLRVSEQMLLAVLIDRLMAGFFERIDLQPSLGVPRKPIVLPGEELEELARSTELISFTYKVTLDDDNHDFQLIVPLEVFENSAGDRNRKSEEEEAKRREREWSDRIYERVKQVELPHSIEIGKFDVSLSYVATLQVGQKLDVRLDMRDVQVLDPSGTPSFTGDIKTYGNGMALEVASTPQEERV